MSGEPGGELFGRIGDLLGRDLGNMADKPFSFSTWLLEIVFLRGAEGESTRYKGFSMKPWAPISCFKLTEEDVVEGKVTDLASADAAALLTRLGPRG